MNVENLGSLGLKVQHVNKTDPYSCQRVRAPISFKKSAGDRTPISRLAIPTQPNPNRVIGSE